MGELRHLGAEGCRVMFMIYRVDRRTAPTYSETAESRDGRTCSGAVTTHRSPWQWTPPSPIRRRSGALGRTAHLAICRGDRLHPPDSMAKLQSGHPVSDAEPAARLVATRTRPGSRSILRSGGSLCSGVRSLANRGLREPLPAGGGRMTAPSGPIDEICVNTIRTLRRVARPDHRHQDFRRVGAAEGAASLNSASPPNTSMRLPRSSSPARSKRR